MTDKNDSMTSLTSQGLSLNEKEPPPEDAGLWMKTDDYCFKGLSRIVLFSSTRTGIKQRSHRCESKVTTTHLQAHIPSIVELAWHGMAWATHLSPA